jgi:hypothetical protein
MASTYAFSSRGLDIKTYEMGWTHSTCEDEKYILVGKCDGEI